MTALERVCAKLYAPEPTIPDQAFVPVFHDWIRRRVIGGVLLDVADYTHVPNGPGVVLVGHEFTYSLDRSDGRFGLLVQRRRSTGADTESSIAATIRALFEAADKLEAHRTIRGAISFDRALLRIEANDRLRAPNDLEAFATLRRASETAINRSFPNAVARVDRVDGDSRDRLAVTVSLGHVASLAWGGSRRAPEEKDHGPGQHREPGENPHAS